MPSTPRVSILMATRNRARIISQGIESVRNQTFQDWELLVIDDGSPDDTADVMRVWQAKDRRIVYLQIERLGSVAKVSNAGLEHARGEYIAILDDDDWWIDPRKLEKQVAFLEQCPDYVVCGGGFAIVDGEGRETARILKPEQDDAIRQVALSANPIVNGAALFRKSAGVRYDESFLQFADWEFWLALGKHGKFYNFQEYFLAYRMWDDSGSFREPRQNAHAFLVIVRRYRNDYPGYLRASVVAWLYFLYSYVPLSVRRRLNAFLSVLKKKMFSH